jgi:hypothetical protein
MSKVKVSWKNSKGKTVSNVFSKDMADAIVKYLNGVVDDVKTESVLE